MGLFSRVRTMLGVGKASAEVDKKRRLEWLSREEARQIQEVRERLERIRGQLMTIDHRRNEQGLP